ncbi:MAG: methionine biosynthesis protein MetW [Rhodospirillales bacterium]|jgi:methionine biosynthesis protein MetW|nr:methionine biosynthesis protein MetW [Rhodospirillales bacterium]
MKIEETARKFIRADLLLVADMVKAGSRVLDVGCGDGILLDYLARTKEVDGRGIELSSEGVNACVSAGLSVIQGDADTDLADYPDKAFDYAILSQTLQATRAPREVLANLARIGHQVIISFPNFAYWRVRWHLSLAGRMPVTKSLPHHWYDTPNIHFCTIRDFIELCAEMGITVETGLAVDHQGKFRTIRSGLWRANLFGEQAVFLLRKV